MRLPPPRWALYLLVASGLAILWIHQHYGGIYPRGRASDYPAHRERRIAAFWQRWSRAMHEARPECAPISLSGAAPISTKTPEGPRRPYHDLVENPAEDLECLRVAHARFVGALRDGVPDRYDEDTAEFPFAGRGVVMVGGGEFFGPAIVSIHMLRRTGSRLPVEVFVLDEDEYEAEVCESYLPRLGARCVVLSRILRHPAVWPLPEPARFRLKAPALLLSSFAEAVLLDSDAIPLVDPQTAILDAEPYGSGRAGLLVWPDFWAATESPRFWDAVAGLAGFPADLPATSSESGQVVVDKRTHGGTLLLATYYNVFGDSHYYPLLSQGALGQGDKETFLAAAVVLNASYYRARTPVVAAGRHDGVRYRATGMVQHLPGDEVAETAGPEPGPAGRPARPAFLHANTPKMNAGHLVDEGDLVSADGQSRQLRLLGSAEDQIKLFGHDLEPILWDVIVRTGCELAHMIREWRGRDGLCLRLAGHRRGAFGPVRPFVGRGGG